MMKKLLAIMLSLSLCISLSACKDGMSSYIASQEASEIFRVGDYPILITTPNGWTKEDDMGSFDLQCRSPKRDMYLSVYGYYGIDLAEEQTTQELFELQINEILSLRDNVTEIEPATSTEGDERTLYSSYYSGEQDGCKYYYRFYFIRFKTTDDMAWISFNGMPSVVEKNKEAIDEIVSKVQNGEAEKEIEEWEMP